MSMITRNGKDALWPFGRQSSTVRALEDAFRVSLGLKGRLSDAKAQIEASGKFSPRGATDEHRRLAREQHLPAIVKGDLALRNARKSVTERLSKLTPKPADKTDLVGFFRRESIRDELRRMPPEQRALMLTRHAAELDPEVALAAIEAVELPWTPASERLVSPETRSVLMRRTMPAEDLAAIDELEQAIAYASPTIEGGKREIMSELAMRDPDFEQAVRAEAAKTPPVWLRKSGERVIVVTPGGTERAATADELERGTYFKSFDEYQAALAEGGTSLAA